MECVLPTLTKRWCHSCAVWRLEQVKEGYVVGGQDVWYVIRVDRISPARNAAF